jgi:uncharacterized protein YbjT (DUF2867 family)
MSEALTVVVFGGSGLTGRSVIDGAIQRGFRVVAFTRDASRFPVNDPHLEVIEGSATSGDDVLRALKGADAVIHCLGIGGKGDGAPTSFVSDSVRVVLGQMKKARVQRIVCMSNVGAGGSGNWLYRLVVLPLFLRWLRPIIADKDVMELALRESSIEWVSVRFPNIVPGPLRPVRASADGTGIGISITATSAAGFLVSQLSDSQWLRQTPSVSN